MIIRLPNSGEFVNLDNFSRTRDREVITTADFELAVFKMDEEDTEFLREVLTHISELNLIELGLRELPYHEEAINREVERRLEALLDRYAETANERQTVAAEIDRHETDPDYDGEIAW